MRFTTTFVAGIFAFVANAQTTESVTSVATADVSTAVTSVTSEVATTTATTTREPTPEESLQAEAVECVEACPDSDVNCQARCITVPNPDETAVNQTTSCVAECPQGDGTEEDNAAYGECVQSCIADHYLTTTFTGQPTNTGGSSQGSSEVTATASPSVSTVTSGSSTFETTVTPTETTGSPSETEGSSESEPTDAPNGGALPFSPIGATGLLGLVAAFFAL
ncbi:hypothetical protein DL769_005379 [Monosporascus sp. CRB-8-3]|nr:hypothetical protein DL769_005379 [Monosporascus sp. CRB-8-3]